MQVTNVREAAGVVTVDVEEYTVQNVHLRFVDPKSEEPLSQGATRPEVLRRLLCNKPGQVGVQFSGKGDKATTLLSPKPKNSTPSTVRLFVFYQ